VKEGPRFTLSLVVAVADNGVIGRAGALPWRLSSDLRRFRKLTMGHPLIMGKNTYISIGGKPLDGRDNIVVAERGGSILLSSAENYYWAKSLEEALAVADSCAEKRGVNEVFVIGGARLFAETLPLAQRVYLTRVHASPEGDVRWEPPLGADWRVVSTQDRPASDRDEFPVTDVILERASGA
jgi:dihydrofolate reductase